MRILHLSDTHLTGDGSRHFGVVDTMAALRRVLDSASGIDHLDAVVCSGDLTDDGSPEAYRALKVAVETWARPRGAEAVYVMGNHDERAGFEQVLGERTGVVTVAGLRIVRLDSSVPGSGYGAIDAGQLDWLRDTLADSDAPTIVVLHHPPIPAITPLLKALELQDRDAVLEVCRQGAVRAILAGHYHHSLVTTKSGVPVIVAPGITNTTDILAPDGHERALVGSGYAVVDIEVDTSADPRVVIRSALGPDDGDVIFDHAPDRVAAIAADAGPRPVIG